MLEKKALLVVSARALLGQVFPSGGWNRISRMAYVEPIVVQDGYHDFVLMGAPDYEAMTGAAKSAERLSENSRSVLRTLPALSDDDQFRVAAYARQLQVIAQIKRGA